MSVNHSLALFETISLEAAFCLNKGVVSVGHALRPYFSGKIIFNLKWVLYLTWRLTVRNRTRPSWSTY